MVSTSVVVSNTIGMVFQPQGVPQSNSVSDVSRQDRFMQFLLSISPTCVDFLMDIYAGLYGMSAAKYLLKSHRQYETAWKSLVCFVNLKKPTMIAVSFMLEFLIWLFEVALNY